MPKTNLIVRLAAFGASAAITFTIVTVVAQYALPADSGAQLLAQAKASAAK
jgi:hypothetical protein